MPYSLVSAATLGFDLVRLPAGRSVATVLLAGLGADARSLAAVAAVHPGRGLARGERGVLAVRSRKARELAASVPHMRSAAVFRLSWLITNPGSLMTSGTVFPARKSRMALTQASTSKETSCPTWKPRC